MRLITHQIWQIYGSYENVYYFIFFFSYFSKSVEEEGQRPPQPLPLRGPRKEVQSKPLHNDHLGDTRKWPLWRGSRLWEVGV